MRLLEREKYLDDRELALFLRAIRSRRHANAVRDHALFALLVNTGIRPGEALALTWGNVRLTDRDPYIRIHRLKKRRDNGVIDDLPIARALARLMVAYRDAWFQTSPLPQERVFPTTIRNVEERFKFYVRSAGLGRPIKLYALRHTAGTRAWRATRDLLVVQQQLGHASPLSTQVYTHVDPEARRKLADTVLGEV